MVWVDFGFSRVAGGFRFGVAAEHPAAVLAAVKILESGGNAVDAAVAASLVLGVVQPHLGGVGGDFFAVVWDGGRVWAVDGAGPTPAGLSLEVTGGVVPGSGPLSVTVPGMVDGLYRLWVEAGSLAWEDLVLPAARLAFEGFPRHPELERALTARRGVLEGDPGSRRLLESLERGRVRLPGLGRLLRLIAEDPRAFYEGDPARRITSYVQERGGVLSVSDLAVYRARLVEPVSLEAFGCRLFELPPPTQGVTGLHLVRLLEEHYESGAPEPFSRKRGEALLSASRVAYWARDNMLADPERGGAGVEEILAVRSAPPSREGRGNGVGGDTTFYVIATRDMVVAGIQSLYHHFGSGVTEPYYMVTLNNRARDFSSDPSHPNRLEPLKRPRHTLSALIAECDDRILALGASGGNFRPQQHALLYTNIAAHGMGLNTAINAPRLLWDPETGRVINEGWDYEGERLMWPSRRTGVAAGAIVYKGDGRIEAYSDPRGVGVHVTG